MLCGWLTFGLDQGGGCLWELEKLHVPLRVIHVAQVSVWLQLLHVDHTVLLSSIEAVVLRLHADVRNHMRPFQFLQKINTRARLTLSLILNL